MINRLEWVHADQSTPDTVLVVYSRTIYSEEGWERLPTLWEDAVDKIITAPGVVGISFRAVEPNETWSVMAWTGVDALEQWVQQYMTYLREVVNDIGPYRTLHHSAYRWQKTNTLPPSWDEVERVLAGVIKASPLGADAFPELTQRVNN